VVSVSDLAGDSDSAAEDQPLPFRTKGQAVYEQLRDWIVRGKLGPGAAVDQERLAESLKVSRMPLRQALQRLESEGLIERRPHHTAVVTSFSQSDIRDIYAARSVLEGLLAEQGSAALDDHGLSRLAAIYATMAVAVPADGSDAFVRSDWDVHQTIYRASGYLRTMDITEQLRSASERYMHYYAAHEPGAAESLAEHAQILQACQAGDPRLVRQLTETHISRSATKLVSLVGPDDRD
jgi:GntR family transcriptional regulator, rspAB operon transcriptional repressor